MSTYDKQDKDWIWKESGEDWGNWGLACLLCGEKFYGGIDNATKPLLAHSAVEHKGQRAHYCAFATPLSSLAKSQAQNMMSVRETVKIEKILRDHGSGWYFYALYYGADEALDHIEHTQEMEVKETLRDKVQQRKPTP